MWLHLDKGLGEVEPFAMRRLFLPLLAVAFAYAADREPALAQMAQGQVEQETVDLELVLAVDVSRSMSPRELEIQRRGYAQALIDREVIAAIQNGIYGQIALTYIEWAGALSQRTIVGWTLIRTEEDAVSFAARLTAHFDRSLRRTSISGALDFASGLFDGNGFQGLRRVIDVSGDGPNNEGRMVTLARDEAVGRGIVINGLPLMTQDGLGGQWRLKDLDLYYRDCVIGGPGAFVVPVLEWAHFPAAVRRKLVLELAGSHLPSPSASPLLRIAETAADCLIGEKIWDTFMGDMQ